MRSSDFLAVSICAAVTLARPTPQLNVQDWNPADGTTVACNLTDTRAITFFQGPYNSTTIAQAACKALMPKCAYPPPDLFCTETIDFSLNGPKSTTINATVLVNENKSAKYALRLDVIPPSTSDPVMWTKADCEGYFEQFLEEEPPSGCNADGEGRMGELTVGDGSLQDTVFKASIVTRRKS